MYFLIDITSLPQDVFYIWTTTNNFNLSTTWYQVVSFGLPFANIAGIIGLMVGLNAIDWRITPETMIPFIP